MAEWHLPTNARAFRATCTVTEYERQDQSADLCHVMSRNWLIPMCVVLSLSVLVLTRRQLLNKCAASAQII